MARELRGGLDAHGLRIGVLVAQFNEVVTSRLLGGAREALAHHGIREEDITIAWVPGSLELPQLASRMASAASWDALVTLGCVIRGDTPHFDYVCTEASAGLGAVARSASIPVLFGVLTTDDHSQALARAGDGKDNKGYEAAFAALKMVDVYKALE